MLRFPFLVAVLVALPAERLRPSYTTSTFEFRDVGVEDMRLEDIEVEVAGAELPEAMLDQMRQQMQSHKTRSKDVRVLTTVHEVADGRIVDVSHDFQRLELEIATNGDTERHTGPLEGKTVRLVRQGDDEFEVTAIDGKDDFDAELVADLAFRPHFGNLLPTTEVSEGDSWTAGPEFFEAKLAWLSVDMGGEGDDEEAKPKLQEFLEGALDGELPNVTWTTTDVVDEERIAVLVLAFETPFDAAALLLAQGKGVPEGAELSGTGDLSLELTLRWRLADGLPQRLTGNLAVQADFLMSFPLEEGVTMSLEMVLAGTVVNESTWSYTP